MSVELSLMRPEDFYLNVVLDNNMIIATASQCHTLGSSHEVSRVIDVPNTELRLDITSSCSNSPYVFAPAEANGAANLRYPSTARYGPSSYLASTSVFFNPKPIYFGAGTSVEL